MSDRSQESGVALVLSMIFAILLYILVQGWLSAGLWPSRWLAMACVGVVLYRLVKAPEPES